MSLPRFDLLGDDDCPVAQGIALALGHRRTFFRRGLAPGATVLRITNAEGEGVRLEDPLAMFDWLEHLLPDAALTEQPAEARRRERALMRRGASLAARIEAITRARFPRDLDLAQHFLHEDLLLFEAEPAPAAPTALDFLIAPALWRIRLLDLYLGAHLLDRLPGLRARIERFLALPATAQILNEAAAGRYLAAIRAADGEIATAGQGDDWSRAFAEGRAPADSGAEPAAEGLPPARSRRISEPSGARGK